MPTICDAAGIERPGCGDNPILTAPLGTDPSPTRCSTSRCSAPIDVSQGLEGHDRPRRSPDHVERERVEGSKEFDDRSWELFNLEDDFAEAHDLSATHPEKLKELEELWWSEAGRNQVLPLDDSFILRAGALEPRPYMPQFRTTYRPGGNFIAEDFLPPLGLGFDVIADIEQMGDGMIAVLGDWNNGWALYVLAGKPVVAFSLFSKLDRLEGPPIPAGASQLRMGFRPHRGQPGALTIAVDGDVVAEGALSGHLPFRWQIGGGGLQIGHDTGFPVCDDYTPPFAFTGVLTAVHIEVPILAPPPAAEDVSTALRRE